MDQLYQSIDEHHKGQVVRDLLVVGLNLETERKAEEGCAQKRFPYGFFASLRMTRTVSVNQRRQHPGHEGDGLHLGVVAHLDNLEVVAAEGHGDGASYGHGPADAQGKKQQEGAQQAYEYPRSRTLACKEQLVERLRIVSAVLGGDGRGGHAAEHGVCPVGWIVRVGLVPLAHLMRHAHIAGNVALVHYLAVQNLRHKTVTQGQKQGHDAQGKGYFLPNLSHTTLFIVYLRCRSEPFPLQVRYVFVTGPDIFRCSPGCFPLQVRTVSVAGPRFFSDLRR